MPTALSAAELKRVVIGPLAGARGYRKVQSAKDVGMSPGYTNVI